MKRRNRYLVWILFAMTGLFMAPLTVCAQGHGGGGGGGGGGCGDVFGDLIHILRDDTTGQPILAQRWVEMPAQEPGYGWGYCPIGVYYDGQGNQQEIPFLPYSCDMDPAYADLVEEVDYFGRLNGGRTKERNHRMHFDEVISNIKLAGWVTTEVTGRLKLGFSCPEQGAIGPDCYEWATIDSPMESMALYVRLMKYGHLQTDPLEEDIWAHGDPKLPIQYHPALSAEDWTKFDLQLSHLLAGGKAKTKACWDKKSGAFDSSCAEREELEPEDFASGSVYLAAAANKTGFVTVDLVQYVNRFLKITKDTETTLATLNTLPARYRDCWDEKKLGEFPGSPEEDAVELVDAPYDPIGDCKIEEAGPGTPNYDVDLFPDIVERFVDYGQAKHSRPKAGDKVVNVILDHNTEGVFEPYEADLLGWQRLTNGDDANIAKHDIGGFVAGASDVLRAIEYVHNYAIPEDLYCIYDPAECYE
jgi:hypothetical protein